MTKIATPNIIVPYLVLTSSMWELFKLFLSLLASPVYFCLHLNKLFLDTNTHHPVLELKTKVAHTMGQ